MNDFSKFNRIRSRVDRGFEAITNVSDVTNESGFRRVHILWLYPDVMNIHGGRGDVMGLIHVANLMGLPVEIRRCDSLKQNVDWSWAHMAYMTAGELKCVLDVVHALKRQEEEIKNFAARGGVFLANGSSGAVLADTVELWGGKTIKALDLLRMNWKARESVWGDDIWIRMPEENLDIIGNQIQVADVSLGEGQEALGELVYGRGNDGSAADGGSGLEGARTGNVIYTGVLGPLITKNPLFAASVLKAAAEVAGIEVSAELKAEDIEIEMKSMEYIKTFMLDKMKNK